MFLTDCHTCGLRELRGARAIETLVNTGSGVELVYRCTRCEALSAIGCARSAATATHVAAC